MDDDTRDDLLRRLTALVVKLDEREDHLVALLDELRDFNRQQLRINADVGATLARLETLMSKVFEDRDNGQG